MSNAVIPNQGAIYNTQECRKLIHFQIIKATFTKCHQTSSQIAKVSPLGATNWLPLL